MLSVFAIVWDSRSGKLMLVDGMDALLQGAVTLEEIFLREVNRAGGGLSMMILWPLAVMTFKEGIRHKVFYSISLLALLFVGANIIVTSMIPQEAGKVLWIWRFPHILYRTAFILFIGINLIEKDLDKRTIYMILSRPISRAQYIVGKFTGMK